MSSRGPAWTSLAFTVVDVFTESPFSGNPLAIVRLPSSTSFLPRQAQLQQIASEFNLSETIFLEDATPEDLEQQICRARIFTTTREILFAGHPTIGAATWLLHLDPSPRPIKSLVPGAGSIAIAPISSQPGYVSAVAPHTYHRHQQELPANKLLALHSTLGPHIEEDQTFPIISIVHGMTFVLVELDSLKALAAARLGNQSATVLANSGILDAGWEYDSPLCVYLYVRQAEPYQGVVEVIRTRMLIRGIEDPATGSAASALTGFLALKESSGEGGTRQWKIVQGVEMGRKSEIGVVVVLNPGEDTSSMKITLSGTAVIVSEGMIRLPHDDLSGP